MPLECQLPDLAITDFIIYEDDVKSTSLEYYYEITNLGLADLGTSGVLERVGVQVYYSQDKVIDRNDQAGGGFMRGGTLAAGESYDFIASSNTLSNSRLISNYKYLIFEIDIIHTALKLLDMYLKILYIRKNIKSFGHKLQWKRHIHTIRGVLYIVYTIIALYGLGKGQITCCMTPLNINP